jgi:hypothetical protein
MTPRNRLLVALVGMAAAVACAVPVSGEPRAVGPDLASLSSAPESSGDASPRLASPVREPLDARGIKACDLLTSSQLLELGLKPETAKSRLTNVTDMCAWASTEPGNVASVELGVHPAIPALDGIYLNRDAVAVFEPTEVAGHPAVHTADTVGGACTIYTAIADYQVVGVTADEAGRPRADPCAPSRRMTELILSNLPPLR